MRNYEGSYGYIHNSIGRDLCSAGFARRVPVKTWHAMDNPPVSIEIRNVNLAMSMPRDRDEAIHVIEPQLPWAEDHFEERVSGQPLNPPPSAGHWLDEGVADKHRHDYGGPEPQYSHTYPERMWPRAAGQFFTDTGTPTPAYGIRFEYGDLFGLVRIMRKDPLTRQAFLPIWFPEDIEAANTGQRVPCTLGYHFLMREGQLHCTYMIRSVDYVRHFHDDVYLAVRLAQWVANEITDMKDDPIRPGQLTMHVMSMHCFEPDLPKLRRKYGIED